MGWTQHPPGEMHRIGGSSSVAAGSSEKVSNEVWVVRRVPVDTQPTRYHITHARAAGYLCDISSQTPHPTLSLLLPAASPPPPLPPSPALISGWCLLRLS
jgi:hypothetical protein